MATKIDLFLLSNDKNNESIKEANILLNKSEISFESIRV